MKKINFAIVFALSIIATVLLQGQTLTVNYPNTNITKYGGDSLNISFSSSYDSIIVYFVIDSDTVIIDTTTSTQITYSLPYGRISNSCYILISNILKTHFDISDNPFTLFRDTSITITNPTLNQHYSKNASLTVSFIADFDTAKIYFRFNKNSAWEYKGIALVNNRNGSFNFNLNYDFTKTASIMVTSTDSLYRKQSQTFFILPTSYLAILSPTETDYIDEEDSIAVKVMSANIIDFNFYVDKGDGYVFEKNIIVDEGDNENPDTTTFYFNYKKYLNRGSIKLLAIRGSGGLINGSMDTAYYQHQSLSSAGYRHPAPQFQSKTKYSKIFNYGDSLYSICYRADWYGWSSYNDRVEIYKFNPETNRFNLIFNKYYPHSSPYPTFDFYRTNNNTAVLVKPDTYFRVVNYYINLYQLSEMSGIIYKSSTNPIPPNIDKYPTTTTTLNFWEYRLINNKIYAYDLINRNISFMLIDLSYNTSYSSGLVQNQMDIYSYYDKLFITNHSYSGNANGITYTLTIFPKSSTLGEDEVEFYIQGKKRNTFRGIYPKAIIKTIPKL